MNLFFYTVLKIAGTASALVIAYIAYALWRLDPNSRK